MKKILIPMLFLFILMAACSLENETEGADPSDGTDLTEETNGEEGPHPESLFTYEFSEDDRYDFTGIYPSHDGHTVLFTTEEEIKFPRLNITFR